LTPASRGFGTLTAKARCAGSSEASPIVQSRTIFGATAFHLQDLVRLLGVVERLKRREPMRGKS